ncbi:ATP synthase F1 subunit gamma [Paenibacillus senegalensis]|uniref:ATP synthase F1 subunit gamma n=1 Tax=Paenibacillus senegalensis TaxID=1465766 RepID=UPI00028A0003|nr:ATP synthase F1 subunit gamma [Paenibacillus senegalensis]
MAKGMREIKRSIKSTQNTKQMTKAMEMIAASRLKKTQDAALASRPYADKLKEVISNIAAGTKDIDHPMLEQREIKRTGYLVITSDRGMAGGYNANLLRKLVQTLNERHQSPDEYALFVMGRKGRDFLRKRGYAIQEELVGISDSPQFADVKSIAYAAIRQYEEGGIDELYLVYSQFINAISQKPTEKRILPLQEDMSGESSTTEYEYEPNAATVLAILLPKYAETLVYSAVIEAKASEFGARMTAMGNASKNATKLISSLTLQYNRARQAAITQEISEIVAGANAQS